MVKNCIIIQARQTSTRFPDKIFGKLGNTNLISYIIDKFKNKKNLIFVIPNNKSNLKLKNFLIYKKVNYYAGKENDVLSRYYYAAKKFKVDNIVRITCDCPLVDTLLINKMLKKFNREKLDYLSNVFPPTFPDGFDIEIFNFKTLKKTFYLAKKKYDREHVTSFIKSNINLFKHSNLSLNEDFSDIKLSVDTFSDLKKINTIIKYLNNKSSYTYKDVIYDKKIINLLRKTNVKNLNKITKKSNEEWSKAKKIIPGGNMLLSKNPDRYLPNIWPAYYKSAKGCKIVDIDNNNFIDLSTMGVGTNILGYANNLIDNHVKKVIDNGNICSLNCHEEFELAELLIDIHPNFEMVKFAKTGGEANAIAIRIARAYSNKDNVAICGYHGWHDWYLAANLNNSKTSNLNTHLIKGLDVSGVPKKLRKTTFTFEYGNFKNFDYLINNKDIGIVKMEVCRNTLPNQKFLRHVRRKTKEMGIILIFDECTTGFRQTLGGVHKLTNIKPDMLILGKALGNGYPITAVLGMRDVMMCANKSFISSTFWTDRIGYAAAIKTIEIMQKTKSWDLITKIGIKVQKNWKKIFNDNKIKFKVNGLPALSNFTFKNNNLEYRTLISQEMLKSNILASSNIYVSVCHTERILNKYFNCLNDVANIISKCENGSDIKKFLKTEVARKDFQRLN